MKKHCWLTQISKKLTNEWKIQKFDEISQEKKLSMSIQNFRKIDARVVSVLTKQKRQKAREQKLTKLKINQHNLQKETLLNSIKH